MTKRIYTVLWAILFTLFVAAQGFGFENPSRSNEHKPDSKAMNISEPIYCTQIFDDITVTQKNANNNATAANSSAWSDAINVSKAGTTHNYMIAIANGGSRNGGQQLRVVYQFSPNGSVWVSPIQWRETVPGGDGSEGGIFSHLAGGGFSGNEGTKSITTTWVASTVSGGAGPYVPTLTFSMQRTVSPTYWMRYKIFNDGGRACKADLWGCAQGETD